MPKSRNRKTKEKRLIRLPVHRVRETKVGPVNEHVGFRVIGREPVAPNMGRLKTDLEKEAYRAWKQACRDCKNNCGHLVDKHEFITNYLSDVSEYHRQMKEQKEAV